VAGRPGHLGGVSVAEQPQPTVGKSAGIGLVGWAESGKCFVPGGPLVWGLLARFGADGVAGMVVAVSLPVGRDRGGLVLPVT
jgi:hypothetical protein